MECLLGKLLQIGEGVVHNVAHKINKGYNKNFVVHKQVIINTFQILIRISTLFPTNINYYFLTYITISH